MNLKYIVSLGAALLILIGILHAVYVARASDVEPYLWAISFFLIWQGGLTLVFTRK